MKPIDRLEAVLLDPDGEVCIHGSDVDRRVIKESLTELRSKEDDMIKCECGTEWQVQENLSAYTGEVVLVCLSCGERYYNAQDFFQDDDLDGLKRIKTKGG